MPDAVNDHVVYFNASRELAESSSAWLERGSEFGYRAPLYFAYLAALHWVLPTLTYQGAQLATAILGVATGVLAFAIARRLAGPVAGYFALGLRLFLPNFVLADTFVMSESMFSFELLTIVLGMTSLKSRSRWRAGAALVGLGCGLALLTRESATFLPIVFIALTMTLETPLRQQLLAAVAILGVAGLVVSPWCYRNIQVWGAPLPLANTAGINLYVGNNPQATGKWGDFEKIAPADMQLGSPAASAWYARKALSNIASEPRVFVQRGFQKVAWLLFPVFQRDVLVTVFRAGPEVVLVLSLLSGASSAILLLVGIWAVALMRRGLFRRICIGVVLYQVVLAFVVFGSPRFRDPIDHVLLLAVAQMAAGGGSMMLAEARSGKKRIVAAVVGTCLVLCAWSYVGITKLG